MVHKKTNGISAIVPAYNESERIGTVLDTLTTYKGFSEVIVVDDGSTDDTARVAQQYPVKYVRNCINSGKGFSMNKAVRLSRNNVIFFCDADVNGLTHDIIDAITAPVCRGETEMMIGMRNRKIYYLKFILAFIPLLGGERALTKNLWTMLPSYFKHRFRIEAGLNFYAKYYGKGFKYLVFLGLRQTIKEKKYGLVNGVKQRIGMFYDIIRAQLRLEFVDIPKTLKNRRVLVLQIFAQLAGAMFGAFLLVGAYVGPVRFLLYFFRQEFIEGPQLSLARLLLISMNTVGASILWYVGMLIIIANFAFLPLSIARFLKEKQH
jgi:glycosyltransferase involved in cell wall biosynthesis